MSSERVHPGATCLSAMALERPYTIAMSGGGNAGCGEIFSKPWHSKNQMPWSSSKAQSSRLTALRLGQKGGNWQRVLAAHALLGEWSHSPARQREVAQIRFMPPWTQRGRPLRLAVSGGQLHDSQMMPDFLDWNDAPLAIVGDKAYGSRRIRQ